MKTNENRMNSVTKFRLTEQTDCKGKLQIVEFKSGGKNFKLFIYGEKNHKTALIWKTVFCPAWGNLKSIWFTNGQPYYSVKNEMSVAYAHIHDYTLNGIFPDENENLIFSFVLNG